MDSIKVSAIPLSRTMPRLFSFFADKPWAIFLDSAAEDHVNSNFSIIAADPLATLVTESGQTELNTNGEVQRFKSDPLELLNRTLHHYIPEQQHDHTLPLSLGALGYFGYDLGHYFESLPRIAERDIKLPDMQVGIYPWQLVFDHKHSTYYLMALTSVFDDIWQQLLEINKQETPCSETFALQGDWQANMSEQQYHEKIGRIHDYLLEGDCYQINLAQRFKAPYQGDEWHAYLALRETNRAPFSAFIRGEKSAIISISPERFIQLSQGKIETKPIKGTLPRSPVPEEDQRLAATLSESEKDRAENLMIVDLLRNDISKVAIPGTVEVPELFAIESFPAVHHLVSTVVADIEPQFHATDLLRGAFPGGSITGAPKIRAMEIIEELEPNQRSVYCGAIGYIDANGNMDTSITIRTLVCYDQHIYCWAGGGIVADSTASAEYKETFDKVSKILPTLANRK